MRSPGITWSNANPLARVYEVHHRMEALKGSYQPAITFALLGTAADHLEEPQ